MKLVKLEVGTSLADLTFQGELCIVNVEHTKDRPPPYHTAMTNVASFPSCVFAIIRMVTKAKQAVLYTTYTR